ncbi:uncharacterized protein [Diadema antillarum]|uniref:uncharacterized protein n=1 Tax=Diadema antillarum TaxID=105358 RepID=UPI003A87E3A4
MQTIKESVTEASQDIRDPALAADNGSKDTIAAEEDGQHGTKRKHERTAMGDYIVPKGGKPLTQQAFPSPGPADYLPCQQLTRPAFPHFSIVGRSKDFSANKPAPGPADYDTTGDLIWTDKRVTLKGKGKTVLTEEATDSTNTIGPAQYNVRYLNTGKHAPKLSVSSRHHEKVNVGHPSNALSGNAHGIPTPGPNAYTPKLKDDGSKKSFGILHRREKSLGPGPAAYNVTEPPTSSGYTLGKRLKPQWQTVSDSPSPFAYNVRSKIGKGLAMSIRSRQPYEPKTYGPSPNSYFLRDLIKNSDAPTALITYRPFESDADGIGPSSTHYTISDKTLRRAPRYSFRGICKYPVTQLKPEDTPGPGTYLRPRVFTDNDAPAYTMRRRTTQVNDSVPSGPGPNHYHIAVRHRPDGKKAPSFTMAARCDRKDKRIDNPAPTAYTPKTDTNEGPKYSMTSRPKVKKSNDHPAPNSYNITTNQTVKGRTTGSKATLKGRNTRYLYMGYAFQNSVRLLES